MWGAWRAAAGASIFCVKCISGVEETPRSSDVSSTIYTPRVGVGAEEGLGKMRLSGRREANAFFSGNYFPPSCPEYGILTGSVKAGLANSLDWQIIYTPGGGGVANPRGSRHYIDRCLGCGAPVCTFIFPSKKEVPHF